MKNLFSAAIVVIPLMAEGTGIALASTSASVSVQDKSEIAHNLVRQAGYYLPNGAVPTCSAAIVGYDMYGRPIFQEVCG